MSLFTRKKSYSLGNKKNGINSLGSSSGENLGSLTARGGNMPRASKASQAQSLGMKLGKGLSVKDLQPKTTPSSAGLKITALGSSKGGVATKKKGIVKKAVKAAVGAAIDPVGTFRVGRKIFKRKGQFMTRNDQ